MPSPNKLQQHQCKKCKSYLGFFETEEPYQIICSACRTYNTITKNIVRIGTYYNSDPERATAIQCKHCYRIVGRIIGKAGYRTCCAFCKKDFRGGYFGPMHENYEGDMVISPQREIRKLVPTK